jgi:hypothetical protein
MNSPCRDPRSSNADLSALRWRTIERALPREGENPPQDRTYWSFRCHERPIIGVSNDNWSQEQMLDAIAPYGCLATSPRSP